MPEKEGSPWEDDWLEDKDTRKDAGTETRPFLSILLTNVDKNNAIQSHFPFFMGYHGMTWESMGFYRNPSFYLRLFYVYCNKIKSILRTPP